MNRVAKLFGLLVLVVLTSVALTGCGPRWPGPYGWPGWAFPFWILSVVLYFLPTIIAALRRATSLLAIFLLNLLLGWTFVGWVIALIWSIVGARKG